MSWDPTPAQRSVLRIICSNRPDRQFSASLDPNSGDVLLTVEGGLGGRRINPYGMVDVLTETEIQFAFGDYTGDDAVPRSPEERIAELRELFGDDVDEFSEDYAPAIVSETARLRALLEEQGIDTED